jgi:iron complex transport system substrate-binding protein
MLLTRLIRFSEDDMRKLYPADELKYHGYERSRIDTFLFSRYQGDIKIGDLAAELNISERQVNNVMHKMFGMSFTEKVNELRLQKAAIQLTHTNDPISKISTDCGYKSQNYFLLRFKEKYGKTPTRFRAEKRPEDALFAPEVSR